MEAEAKRIFFFLLFFFFLLPLGLCVGVVPIRIVTETHLARRKKAGGGGRVEWYLAFFGLLGWKNKTRIGRPSCLAVQLNSVLHAWKLEFT